MGEEYVRRLMILGSVPNLGPVILYDDMEGYFKWVVGGTVGDRVCEKDATECYNDSNSLRIVSRATGATEGDLISAARNTYQRAGQRYRLELLHRETGDNDAKLVRFYVYVSDGTHTHYIDVRYDAVNHKWQYKDTAGDWQDVSGGSQNLHPTGWHRLLLEWDESTQKYIRLVSDGLEVEQVRMKQYLDHYLKGTPAPGWMIDGIPFLKKKYKK